MGNRIGVDISGSFIRVSCICYGQFNSKNFMHHGKKLTYCPRRQKYHDYIFAEEKSLNEFLKEVLLWDPPRSFCFDWINDTVGKAFCFLIDSKNLEQTLNCAIKYLKNQRQSIKITGSGASSALKFIANHPKFKSIQFNYIREINCLLEAVEFLVCCVPGACFRYQKTSRALNTVLPDDKDHCSISLDQNDIDTFYPFLLVNVKAGVSFHIVRGPNSSVRVGGSTIGAGTFMGLIRLLCPSVHTPLDAFILAQSGNNAAVDMLVADIYGGNYGAIGLKKETIASTFGKAQNFAFLPLTPKISTGNKYLSLNQPNNLSIYFTPKNYIKDPEMTDSSHEVKTTTDTSQENLSKTNNCDDCICCSTEKIEKKNLPDDFEIKNLIHQSNSANEFTPNNINLDHGLKEKNVSFCNDPACCCCGSLRWRNCQDSGSSEAAGLSPKHSNVNKGLIVGDDYSAYLDKHYIISKFALTDKFDIDSLLKKKNDYKKLDSLKSFEIPEVKSITEADIARSILTMMSYNIAQLAYFNAVIQKCDRIVLIGCYLEMPGYLSSIQHCIDFWSSNTCKINFMRLAPNLGALGASLLTNIDTKLDDII